MGWGGGRGEGKRRRRRKNKYNGLKDQSNAQSIVDNPMVSSGWQQSAKCRWYSSIDIYIEGFRPEWCISTIYHA